MASFVKFRPFVENLCEKAFNLGTDTLKIALTAAANAPTNTMSKLADLTEISYTNCSSRTLTVASSSQSAGTYSLVINDLTLTASGGTVGPYRYVIMYDDTATNDELIGYWDRGSDHTISDGDSVVLDFPVGGIITVA